MPAVQLDSSGLATKGAGCGNTAGIFAYDGKLFYVCTQQNSSTSIYVQVWVYSDGSWSDYVGPQIKGPNYVGTPFARHMVSADAYSDSLWIAYSVAADADTHLIDVHCVRFDMSALEFDAPITDYTPEVESGNNGIFVHSNAPYDPGDGSTIHQSRDYFASHLIYATGASSFQLITQALPAIDDFLYIQLRLEVATYSSGTWSYARSVGRGDDEASDLIAAKLTAGSTKHCWFYGFYGDLYHQTIGGSYTLVTDDLDLIPPWDVDAAVYPARGTAVGKPFASGETVYIPYKTSGGAMALATYSGGSWSTETVDSTHTPYAHWTPSNGFFPTESNHGNFCAAYVLSGTLEVIWWDDANNYGSTSDSTQTLWRSRKVSGSWTEPVAVIADASWQKDVDVVVEGTTAHVIFQRYSPSNSAMLTPWYITDGGSGGIEPESVELLIDPGPYSGLTGLGPGSGCGTGARLPAGGAGVRRGCSTYTAT